MTITILPPGGAIAGIDQTVCGNNATVSLNGIVNGGASTGVWGSAGTGTFSNNQSLNTTYTPSAFDILNGSVVLHLTANSCNFASDSLLVTITEAPLVVVGNDLTICSSEYRLFFIQCPRLRGIISKLDWFENTGAGQSFFSLVCFLVSSS